MPRVQPRTSLTLLAGVAALALVACGSTVTKSDVVARANAICINTLRGVRSLPPPAAGGTSVDSLAAYLQKVLPIIEKEGADTRALPRPAQDKAVLDRYVAAVTAAESQYRTLAAAATHGDRGAVAASLAALRANPAPALARQYGLAQCSATAGTGVS